MPGDVHPKIAGQIQDKLQPLQVFIGIKTGIPFGPRRLQQPLALIKAQRLRMNLIHLGHRRDHVRAFGFAFRWHRITYAVA